MSAPAHLYILDTNVLIHDPRAILRFRGHDVCLPVVVLEELDAVKKGISEVARSVREVSQLLDQVLEAGNGPISEGLPLDRMVPGHGGRLLFHLEEPEARLPAGFDRAKPDNQLLAVTLDLVQRQPGRRTVLVSKDINLRIKAHALGLAAEDYVEHQVVSDTNLLYAGVRRLEAAQAQALGQPGASWQDQAAVTWYRVPTGADGAFYPNEFLVAGEGERRCMVVREVHHDHLLATAARDFTRPENAVWGVHARNLEQSNALNLLLDPAVDFVTLLGQAGTGKTLLALAAGLAQTFDQQLFSEIVVTRATVPVGEDIGFLPGTEEEKMTPWMGALEDNLDVLLPTPRAPGQAGGWSRAVTQDLVRNRIRVKSLNFMRGRTFLNKYIIIDEAQNLTPHQLRTLVTRAGVGTKVVCLGNLAQIDTPYISATTSGLTYVVERLKAWPHSGHITLQRVERSRLADHAAEML